MRCNSILYHFPFPRVSCVRAYQLYIEASATQGPLARRLTIGVGKGCLDEGVRARVDEKAIITKKK